MTNASVLYDQVRLMTCDDLSLVLAWRNHPTIRRNMYTQHEISMEEHRCWFERAAQNPCKFLLVFEAEKEPMGFVQFTRLSAGCPVAEWGFYVAPGSPKGMGRRLGRVALKYAFEDIGLHKICGQALAHNESSIRFHFALGFRQEGILRHQYYDGQVYHDVVCFRILKTEWSQHD